MGELFWKLSEEKIEVAAAFSIMFESGKYGNEIKTVDVTKKISEWKKDMQIFNKMKMLKDRF